MQLSEILSEIDVWEDWKSRYVNFVPQFILEAKTKQNWSEWDPDIFYEYFERSNNQCVSSLRQGYFTKEEQSTIKDNWPQISPYLKQIAENQTEPQFDLYLKVQDIILSFTNSHKGAAINRLIAGLQPNLLLTIVSQRHLNELHELLKNRLGIQLDGFTYSNWFNDSYITHSLFKKSLPLLDPFDLITYPWQTLEYLRDNDTKPSIMNENEQTIINLLKYKKQIILQGPPGTAKTKLAKEIATTFINGGTYKSAPPQINDQNIIEHLKLGNSIADSCKPN